MEKLSVTQNDLIYGLRFMIKSAKFFVEKDPSEITRCENTFKGIFNIHYKYTKTLKALEKKGYLKIIKYATAHDRRHYMTVVSLRKDLLNV